MQIHKYQPKEVVEYIYAHVLLPPIRRSGGRGKFGIIRVPISWVGKRIKIMVKSSKPSLNNDFIQDCLDNLNEFWLDTEGNLNYRQKCLGKIKQS